MILIYIYHNSDQVGALYIYTIAAEANKHRNAVLPILTDMTEGLRQEGSYLLFGDQGSSRTVG